MFASELFNDDAEIGYVLLNHPHGTQTSGYSIEGIPNNYIL